MKNISTKKLLGIIIGALLICYGVVYALDIFEVANISFSPDGWWTIFIILPCLSGLLTSRDKLGSLLGLSVGVLLLLAARDVIDYGMIWKVIIPIIIVGLGIKLIIKSIGSGGGSNTGAKDEQRELMAAFAEQNADYSGEEFTVAKLGAVFGGANANLKNAKIVDGAHIDVLCVFGGVDIFLPDNVIVKNNSFALFGGISDKRENINADNCVTLYVNGFCMFGGADIK